MSTKKVTIKDVAREAGVSVATVSYVVNERTDVKISEETRKKVLQVINLLNYSPNQAAKALASNKKSQIGLAISDTESPLILAEQMILMKALSHFLHEKDYDLFLVPPGKCEKFGQADAIICYDLERSAFTKLGDCNFAPLLALDCFINDPLFFQINTDTTKLKDLAKKHFKSEDYQYVVLRSPNQEKEKALKATFKNILFVDSINDFDKINSKNVLVTNKAIKDNLPNNLNVLFSSNLMEEKISLTYDCYEQAVNRLPITEHDLFV